MNDPNVENFLEHYGVLGMKWGIHKGRADQSYAKAYDKLRRIDAKTKYTRTKAKSKYAKAQKKYIRSRSNKKAEKALKKIRKAARLNDKADKRLNKAINWYKKTERTFTNVQLSNVRQEDINIGKAYAQMIFDMDRR